MENFYPPTQQDRYESADCILAEIGCGRYDKERRDSAIIEDLLLVIERMDNQITQTNSQLESLKDKFDSLEYSLEDFKSRVRTLEDK